jgi:hypothetical protein
VIHDLPPVGPDGSIDWLTAESLGFASGVRIKAFYHGNLLFAVREKDFTVAKRIMEAVFTKPVSDYGHYCVYCNAHFPNSYVEQTHCIYRSRVNLCPCKTVYKGNAIPGAFVLSDLVLTFLNTAAQEMKRFGLPFPFLDASSLYTNYMVDNPRHSTKELRDLVKQERGWLSEGTTVDNFLMFLYTKTYHYERLSQNETSIMHSMLYPKILSMPFVNCDIAVATLSNISDPTLVKAINAIKKRAATRGNGRRKKDKSTELETTSSSPEPHTINTTDTKTTDKISNKRPKKSIQTILMTSNKKARTIKETTTNPSNQEDVPMQQASV